jgi:hypothetical protein
MYDTQNLAAGPYANAVDGTTVENGTYAGLTPDGKYIITGKISWAIDHAARSVATSGVSFWNLCGDHGSFISASDGHDYMITSNCYDANELWRVDITNNVADQAIAVQKAAPNNMRLLALPSWNFDKHVTTVSKGPFRDWAFFSIEDGIDNFDGSVSPWLPYQSEIIGINVITGEIRRLADHRSRSTNTDYYNQPRLSVSWGGEYIGWSSNYNQNRVVDIFATPFAPAAAPSLPSTGGPVVVIDNNNTALIVIVLAILAALFWYYLPRKKKGRARLG